MAQDFPIKRLICDPFDNRVHDRQVKLGIVTLAALAEHDKALPDCADQAEEFTVYLGEDPEDGNASA